MCGELKILSDAELKKYEEQKAILHIYDVLKKNKQLLTLMAAGKTYKEIGVIMFRSARTMEFRASHLCAMMGCTNKTALIAVAIRMKIIE